MSIFCQKCCSDGLDHYDGDVFELVQDEPCGECGGLGVSCDALDPIDNWKESLKRHKRITVKIYVGEGKDEFEDFEIAYTGSYQEAIYGAREPGTGLQLEPDEDAGWELEDFNIKINGQWFPFDPDEETATSNGVPPHRCLTVYDRVIELLEEV